MQIVERLNQALMNPELTAAELRSAAPPTEGAQELLGRREALNDCEIFRLNRLLLEAALPGVLAKAARPFPLTGAEFRDLTEALAAAHQQKFGKPLQPERLENKDKK